MVVDRRSARLLLAPASLAVLVMALVPGAARAQSPGGSVWNSIHLGQSDSPDVGRVDFAMFSRGQAVSGLPLKLDLFTVNLGTIGSRRVEGEPYHGRIYFVSAQIGYRLGRFTLAGGVAGVSETTDALSSSFQFHTQLCYRFRRLELGLGHLSNAGIRQPNRGETFLTAGLRF